MIRVVHLTVGLQWGGAENLMASIATRLDPTRYDIKIVALQENGPIGDRLRQEGLSVTALNSAGRWDVRTYLKLQRLLDAEKPHIVHAHLLRANLLACLTRNKHYVIWHDHCTGEWKNDFLQFLEKRAITRSDKIIAVSMAVKDDLLAHTPEIADRLIVIPNAVDTGKFHPLPFDEKCHRRKELFGLEADIPMVGFVGRLDEPTKGLAVLLKALLFVRVSLPQTRLIIVGEGKDRKHLEQMASQLGLDKAVLFLGPRSDVQTLYPAFDILVLPSLSEGFGIVLLEAMACALPVIATRIGGIPEVVVDQEMGRLIPPADEKALAKALEEILKDPERAQRMGQKGLERVRAQFDLKSAVAKLDNLYIDLLT